MRKQSVLLMSGMLAGALALALVFGVGLTGCATTWDLKGQTRLIMSDTNGKTECQLFVPPTLAVVQFDGESVRWPANTLVDVTAGEHTVVCNYRWNDGYSIFSADELTATENFVAGRRYSPIAQEVGDKMRIILNANYEYASNVVPRQGQSLLVIENVDSDQSQNNSAGVYIDGEFALTLLKFKGEKSYYIVPNGTHTIKLNQYKADEFEFVAESETIYLNAKRDNRVFLLFFIVPRYIGHPEITISGREPL
jgi:hypothetical protein